MPRKCLFAAPIVAARAACRNAQEVVRRAADRDGDLGAVPYADLTAEMLATAGSGAG